MSFEHQKPTQMDLFNQPEEVVEARPDIDTGIHQDILEGQERFAELLQPFQLGKKTYNAMTLIKSDESSHKATTDSGVRYVLNRSGLSDQNISRYAERYRSEKAKLEQKLFDLAAGTTIEAAFRKGSPHVTNEQIKHHVKKEYLEPLSNDLISKYMDHPKARNNGDKTLEKLKVSIRSQREMRREIQAKRANVQRPNYFSYNHYRHD